VADTQVAIAVSGGTPGNVVAPSPVTVPRAATAPAQTVALSVGNPGAKTDTYTLTAQVVLASGNVFPVQASFTVTGHVSPIVIGRSPFSPTLPGGAA
jgi:hypothetical protein